MSPYFPEKNYAKNFLSCKAEIVSRLRTLFEGTELEHESFFEDGPIRCRPRDVRLPGETDVDSIVFPSYRNQRAAWLRWGTSLEAAFEQALGQIQTTLGGLPVELRRESCAGWEGGEKMMHQLIFSIK